MIGQGDGIRSSRFIATLDAHTTSRPKDTTYLYRTIGKARHFQPTTVCISSGQRSPLNTHQHLLDKGEIETLVTSLRSITSANAEVIDKLGTEASYFEKNSARMRYPDFRLQHLFVGSGVIEAGCRAVIGSRLKQSGMFWTLRGANSIIALRCCQLNGRFESYWEARAA